jgi:bacteriocin biosynthesis cyclodehydratase domain-containing protein
VVLELPHPGVARLLDLLDGTRSERTVLSQAHRYGISPTDARALLDSLRAAGLVVGAQALLPPTFPDRLRHRLTTEAAALALRPTGGPVTPAQILRRRAAARVAVTGGGRLAGLIAVTLAEAGIGHVAPALGCARDREELAAEIARRAPGTRTAPLRRGEATFAVQAGDTGPAILAAAGYARRRLAHLPVTVRDATAVIGPLVPPAGAPCLHCVDLHRRDRDPEWPEIAAQLARAPDTGPCAVSTLLTAAGVATGEVLAWLDGTAPDTLGASVEVTAGGRLRRRSWPAHPDCSCVRQRRPTTARPHRVPGRS